jgi:anti-sigma B factor antagonist
MLADARRFSLALMVPKAGLAVAIVAGELDIFRAPEFEALLCSIDEDARHLVLDLTDVSFIDSTALSVILRAVTRLAETRGSLDVVCGDANVQRVFEITGLDGVLGLHEARQFAV